MTGPINQGDSTRFLSLMQKLGDRKFSLVVNSPGGSVSDAMVIGRLLRSKGIRTGVLRTIPTNCVLTGPACNPPTSAETLVEARMTNVGARCLSACVWLLLGATQRSVAPGAQIGNP